MVFRESPSCPPRITFPRCLRAEATYGPKPKRAHSFPSLVQRSFFLILVKLLEGTEALRPWRERGSLQRADAPVSSPGSSL